MVMEPPENALDIGKSQIGLKGSMSKWKPASVSNILSSDNPFD
jgi:hypothetical protein